MKKYKANRSGPLKYVITGFFILTVSILVFSAQALMARPLLLLPVLAPLALLLWIYFDTGYAVDGQRLLYHSAFMRGAVDIASIRRIEQGKTMWTGKKPALAPKGLIITYRRHNKIYIAPAEQAALVGQLLKLNPDIELIA
jgi:hypothetical protein